MPMTLTRIDIRIDTTAKKVVENRVEGFPSENSAANLVPGKGRQMTYVKYKWVAPDNRLCQHLWYRHDAKNLIGARPGGDKFFA
jgi:hypothetical protein